MSELTIVNKSFTTESKCIVANLVSSVFMDSEDLVSQSVHKGYIANLPLSHRGQSSISPA